MLTCLTLRAMSQEACLLTSESWSEFQRKTLGPDRTRRAISTYRWLESTRERQAGKLNLPGKWSRCSIAIYCVVRATKG